MGRPSLRSTVPLDATPTRDGTHRRDATSGRPEAISTVKEIDAPRGASTISTFTTAGKAASSRRVLALRLTV